MIALFGFFVFKTDAAGKAFTAITLISAFCKYLVIRSFSLKSAELIGVTPFSWTKNCGPAVLFPLLF